MSSNNLCESIIYRLHKIQFNNEQLSNSIDINENNLLTLISNKQRYLSEIDEALNCNM